MSDLVLTNIDNHIATITLNRPEKHNALNAEMINALQATLKKLDADADVRILILKGNGKSFCAGADIKEMKTDLKTASLADLFSTLNNLSKPTIAQLHGSVLGGAIGLTACCDVATAEQDTTFCFSEVKLGLSPATISPYVIAKIGASQARRYFLTAEKFSANDAKTMQLVHHIGTPAPFIAHLLENGPNAMATTKKLIHFLTLDESVNKETARIIAELRTSKEAQERLKKFLKQ